MDLVDGMRVFVASVETGSFSGAATRLGISPKLASKYMAALEVQLGAQLLHRTTRRLGMTAAGEHLMARAPEWLNELDEMTGALREARRGLSGTLRVSAPVTYGELRLLPLIRRFRAPHPDLSIDLRLSDRFVDLAAEGIDVSIRIGRLDSSALMARKLGQTRLLLVASPAYLARAGRPDTTGALAQHICIRDTNMRGDGAWPLTVDGQVQRITVVGPYLVNSARLARDLALEGEGISLCPDYMVQADLDARRLEPVLSGVCGPQLDIHAVYLGQRKLARRTRAFLDFVAQHLMAGPEAV